MIWVLNNYSMEIGCSHMHFRRFFNQRRTNKTNEEYTGELHKELEAEMNTSRIKKVIILFKIN